MTDKYKNKYRIPSTRLQNWNYGWAAAYFVTICTKNRECYFGDIVDGEIQYSPLGAIADVLWYEIKNHAKNIELDVFQVMPNHIHGIIVINEKNDCCDDNDYNGNNGNGNVETGHVLSLQPSNKQPQTIGQQRFQNQGKNTLSSIIGSYKSAVTKHAHRLGFGFEWQSRFHDHIIRDNESYERIRNYIIDNPQKWENDEFNNQKQS